MCSAEARRPHGGGEECADPYKTLLEGVENLDIIGRSKVMARPDHSVNEQTVQLGEDLKAICEFLYR